jgi:hypothetical protein
MDIKKIRKQAETLSNMGENACPLPELVDMPRGAQWERFLIKLDELGFTVVSKKSIEGIKETLWPSLIP